MGFHIESKCIAPGKARSMLLFMDGNHKFSLTYVAKRIFALKEKGFPFNFLHQNVDEKEEIKM